MGVAHFWVQSVVKGDHFRRFRMRNLKLSRRSMMESLENRRLMSVTLGANLILNPGAEANTGATTNTQIVTPSNWTRNGPATAIKYGALSALPTSSSPGPSDRGKNLFAGGFNDTESDLFQTIDVSSVASQIDAHHIKYTLSGWLGGSGNQNDTCTLFANFQNGSHGFVSQVSLGPVTASQRGNVTKLIQKTLSNTLPAGVRFVQIQMHFEKTSGTYIDGYADSLSFKLTSTQGTISGNVFKDSNGNHAQDSGESALSGWMVYIDKNNNGQFDVGETSKLTDSSGKWSFTLDPGSYVIRVQVRAGFYETAPTALKFTPTFAGGENLLNQKFGVRPINP
jgi:hypothetical protein